MAGIGPILSGVGDIAGLFGQLSQQSKNNAATSALTGGLNSMMGTGTGEVNSLLSNYNIFTTPQLQQLITSLQGQGQTATNAGMGNLSSASGAAGQLQGMAGQLGQQSPYTTQQAGVAGQLQNFQGLTPQQIGVLSTQAGNSANSAAQTMTQQAGGIANPALLAQQGMNTAGQTSMQTALGLGSQAAGENLSALQSAGSLYGQAAGQNLAGQQAAATAVGNAGNLYSGVGATQTGLGATDTGQALQGLNLSGQGLGTAMSSLGNMEGLYTSLLNSTNQATAAQGNPYTSALGGLGSLFTGGAGIG